MPSLPHQPVHPVFAGKELEWAADPFAEQRHFETAILRPFDGIPQLNNTPPRVQTYRNPLPSETDHLGNLPKTAAEEADQAIFNAIPAQRNRQ